MNKLVLTNEELDSIKVLLKELTSTYTSVEDADFLRNVCIYAHELPRRLRIFLNDFRSLETPSGICLISGYPVDEDKIGKTPSHWKWRDEPSRTLEEEILLILFSSLLGEALAWATQQGGHIVHDVMPIKGHEHEQLGTGSEELLTWHNEDAFHPYRGDYLSMMCLRNPDRVATIIASIASIQLDPAEVKALFQPRFKIRPDESHLEKNNSELRSAEAPPDARLESAYRRINQMNAQPEGMAVLYGDPESPYIRIDPYFMEPLERDEETEAAFNNLVKKIDTNLFNLVLEPGDLVFIDNYRTVHGRKPFKARFDGTDRWLKRVNVARDLRKSRDARLTCTSHIIY